VEAREVTPGGGLPLPVCFQAVRAVVVVAVEFGGQAAAPTLDHVLGNR
jgi:hypothetical protein